MKKIIVTTALLLAGTVMVNAEVQTAAQVKANIKARALQMMGTSTRPVTATSSDALGMQIKALNMEMEAKIKAIREEYQVKMKALIAAHNGNGTTTRQIKERDLRDRDERDDDDRPITGSSTVGSSTDDRAIPKVLRLRLDGQVRGANTENEEQGGAIVKFLRGLFGGR